MAVQQSQKLSVTTSGADAFGPGEGEFQWFHWFANSSVEISLTYSLFKMYNFKFLIYVYTSENITAVTNK